MKIVNFNTSYATQNLGDFIIAKAVHEEMSFLFDDSFVFELSTHTPVAPFYQCHNKNDIMRFCSKSMYKFIDGTNIMKKSLLHFSPALNVNILNYRPYKNSILIGAGMDGDFNIPNLYTRLLYKKILSFDFAHSVRDEKTQKLLERMGHRVINTGCPTLWALNADFCKKIPKKKSENVVFTLTDYRKDIEKDRWLISVLKREYKKIYLWLQGVEDLEYFKKLDDIDGIELVPSNLNAYEGVLNSGNVDYVGTRLHAGIYAMRHKVRSIILIVDNRARDMK